jgi:hypothetical protein
MWYHYLGVLIGLYLVGSSIYNIVMSGNRSGWIVNGISTAIGGGLLWWASSGIMTPVYVPPPMLGGRRYRW